MAYHHVDADSLGSASTPGDEITHLRPGVSAATTQRPLAAPALQRRVSQDSTVDRFKPRSYLDHILTYVSPKISTKAGRYVLLFAIVLFAVLAVVGIVVQIYTDAEQQSFRFNQTNMLSFAKSISVEVFDILLLLCDEMQVYYLNNNNAYDDFQLAAQKTMRTVDQKLIFSENWPTDLAAIAPINRVNISSANALKSAVQAMRNMRKAPNGTAETEIIQFYSNVMDNLLTAMRLVATDSPRFPGWHTFLSTVRMVQSYISFKRFAIVSAKLAKENRTVASVSDPIFQKIIWYMNAYREFSEIAAVETPMVGVYLQNLSDQQSAKDIEYWSQFITRLDFATLDGVIWEDVGNRHGDNMYWIISRLRAMNDAAMAKYVLSWPQSDIVSLGLFVAAAFLVVATVPVHIYGTLRLQNQITLYHFNLDLLNEAFVILYDCVPSGLMRLARNREIMPIRRAKDTCVMVLDISNIHMLMSALDFEVIANFLSEFFLELEITLQKYNCFKIDVHGDCIALATGVGEKHYIDHCLELVYAALDIRDFVTKMNEENGEDLVVNLRIGLSVGPCSTRIVYLQVPRMVVVGEVAQAAAIMHATSLPMMVQVTEALFKRIERTNDLVFMRRGPVAALGFAAPLTGYWVLWADDQYDDNADALSMTSTQQAPKKGGYSMANEEQTQGYAYDTHWEPPVSRANSVEETQK